MKDGLIAIGSPSSPFARGDESLRNRRIQFIYTLSFTIISCTSYTAVTFHLESGRANQTALAKGRGAGIPVRG